MMSACRLGLTLTLASLTLVASLALPAAADKQVRITNWTCREEICLRSHQRGEYLTIQARSNRKRPTWIVVDPVTLKNLKPLQATPFTVRAEPGAIHDAGVLAIRNPKRASHHELEWVALRGNPNAVHDDRWHYRMPFGGTTPRPISQGYNGRFSHKGLGAYALDFPMPWGTPILAARGGEIVEVINDMVASGIRTGEFESDNRVIIEHRDGTFAVYAHLRHGGPARVGQIVKQGDLIGLSGDTGFSTGPHLHFAVFKIRRDGKRETLPVRFWNGTARGYTAVAGLIYKPGCPRSGSAACRPGELASEGGTPRSFPAAPATGRKGPRRAPGQTEQGRPAPPTAPKRLENGACQCPNGALLHVDLPCNMVCGR